MSWRLPRRELLSLIGAAVCAGCNNREPDRRTAADPTTRTESPTATPTRAPAAFEVTYAHPTSVEIGTTVSIRIAVTNTGGRAAAFSAPLSIQRADGTQQTGAQSEFGEIPPGETVTMESPPYELNYLGEYTFRLGAAAPTTIRTRPATLEWGGAYRVPAGYRLGVGTPSLQQTYAYVDPDGIDRARSATGEQWAFVPVVAGNPSESAIPPPAASDLKLYPSETPYDRTALTEQPIYQGQPYIATRLQPGHEVAGYVPYAIPDDVSIADLRVVWAVSTGDGEITASWQSDGLPPYRDE